MDEYIADVKADPFQAFAKWKEILTDFAGWVRKKYGLTGSSPANMHTGVCIYMAAYHRIDLTPALDEKAMRIKAMKDQARIARVPEEKLDLIDKLFYSRRAELHILEEYAKEVEKAIRERWGNPCSNGEHCKYQQIHEGQLLQHLKEGWQIVHNLGNGDVIVKR